MIVRGMRVSRTRMVGDPFLGFVGKGLGALARAGGGFVKRAVKAQLGLPAESADSFTKHATAVPIGRKKFPIPQIEIPSGPFPFGKGGIVGQPMRRGRRMRATNVRALRRALRRVEAFGRIARRYVKIRRAFKPLKRRRR